jgi:predicted transcriptional regulator
MADGPPKRLQSQSERDIAGLAARRVRERIGAVPEFVAEEVTGQYQGEELAQMRARRPTDQRIARVEEKFDALESTVSDMRVEVGKIDGKLDVLPRLLSLLEGKNTNEHETKRQGMASRTKVIVTVVGAVGTAIGAVVAALAGRA